MKLKHQPSSSSAPSPTPTTYSGISTHRNDSYRARAEDSVPALPVTYPSVSRIHYNELNRYLADYLAQVTPNSRTIARQKLTRLTTHQFYELSTDVYDELVRRKQGDEVPFLPVKEEFHPRRNLARQKLGALPDSRFEDLSSDVYFELARRYPEFTEDTSGGRAFTSSNYDDYPAFRFPTTSQFPPRTKPNTRISNTTSSDRERGRPSDSIYGGSSSSQRPSEDRRRPGDDYPIPGRRSGNSFRKPVNEQTTTLQPLRKELDELRDSRRRDKERESRRVQDDSDELQILRPRVEGLERDKQDLKMQTDQQHAEHASEISLDKEGGKQHNGSCARCKNLRIKCEFLTDSNICKRCLNGAHECIIPGFKKLRVSPTREQLIGQFRMQADQIKQLISELDAMQRAQEQPLTGATESVSFNEPGVSLVIPVFDRSDRMAGDWLGRTKQSFARFDTISSNYPLGLLEDDQDYGYLRDEHTEEDDWEEGKVAVAVSETVEDSSSSVQETLAWRKRLRDSNSSPNSNTSAYVVGSGEKPWANDTIPTKAAPWGLMGKLSLTSGPISEAHSNPIAEDEHAEKVQQPHILTRGVISTSDAGKLFTMYALMWISPSADTTDMIHMVPLLSYYEEMNDSTSLLDPKLYTPPLTAVRSPFLFTVICAIASRFYEGRSDLYPQLMHYAQLAAGTALISGTKNVEMCAAYILLSLYPVPNRRVTEQRSWLYLGLAIRTATDLNLQYPINEKPRNEWQAREILNRTRIWLNCFNLDRSTSFQYGKPPIINNTDYIANHSTEWYKSSPFNLEHFDIHICAYNAELRVMGSFMTKIHADPEQSTELDKNADFVAISTATDDELQTLGKQWFTLLEMTTDMSIPQNRFRTGLLRLAYSASRLIALSYGFRFAFTRNIADERSFMDRCLNAAQDVVHAVLDDICRPDQVSWWRHGPGDQSIPVILASAFLIKLLRFASHLSLKTRVEIKSLVEKVVELLGSTGVAIDESHGPGHYARFLRNLLHSQTPQIPRQSSLPRRARLTKFDRGIRKNETDTEHSTTRLQDMERLKDWLLVGTNTAEPLANECVEGIRTSILAEIATRLQDLNGKNIIWIYGAPGSGKSSISLTVRSQLQLQGRLITYFSFDRFEASTVTSAVLWRHVAYDLALRLPSVRAELLQQLRDNRLDLNSPMDSFTSLVEAPLWKFPGAPLEHSLVIVIDALDACGGIDSHSSPDRRALLKALNRWSKFPKHFKLLAISRRESDIVQALSPISATLHIPSGHLVADYPYASMGTSNDIRQFLEYRFRGIREKRIESLPADWPETEIIDGLVHRAAGNFMWATSVADFVDSDFPKLRLDEVVRKASESMILDPLYSLYSDILDVALKNFVANKTGEDILRAVLSTVVFSRRPLHANDYTKLPISQPVKRSDVIFIRVHLSSVLEQGPSLRFVHKSFDDFLLSDSCPSIYRIRADASESLLTNFCLVTMEAELHFNMCNLNTSYLKNADVPNISLKVKNGISSLLSYSCCFWAEHLTQVRFNEGLMFQTKKMIYDNLLFWLEAMSLLKETDRVSYSLQLLLTSSQYIPDKDFQNFVHDARQFIGAFGRPIAQSAAHVYISALPFSPEQSRVAKHFISRFSQILALSTGRPADWSTCKFTSQHHKDWVSSVAFSPDEKTFASGSLDETICICDSETGNLISSPFKDGHIAQSTFFDPGGQRIWANYLDGEVVGWDIETGHKRSAFRAGVAYGDVIGCYFLNGGPDLIYASHRRGVVALWSADTGEHQDLIEIPAGDWQSRVSFSNDGRYMAWAGDCDMAMRIWSLVDRCEITSQPDFRGHTRPITALSFSVDEAYAVSGSEDGVVLVLEAKYHRIVGRPLPTGKGEVHAIAYSHKNELLISASGNPGVVMVWNFATHETVLGPLEGHTSRIMAISLSRDGQRLLSASKDRTVKMWDLRRTETLSEAHARDGHSGRVCGVVFTPCGKRLVSLGGDKTVQFWDATTGKPLRGFIKVNPSYTQIVFSPDGSLMAAYDDGTLRVWNANTGELDFHQDLGDLVYHHLAFRSTDHQLVACSCYGVVHVWSFTNNIMTQDLSAASPRPTVAGECVEITTLSPDGMTAVVRDDNRNPHYYLWSTTTCQSLALTLPDLEDVSQLAFSPNGKFLAVVSTRCALRVWNIQTGKLTTNPLVIDIDLQRWCLAFSPDDCHIAVASTVFGHTLIRVWNVHTGYLASGPWYGHPNDISALAFSPAGMKLASGSIAGQIRIFDTTDLVRGSRESAGTLSDGKWMNDDGWVVDEDRQLLFWVPMNQRDSVFWDRCKVVIGGSGIPTQLDMTKFRYGERWAECYGAGE